jgi:hypothetical protein
MTADLLPRHTGVVRLQPHLVDPTALGGVWTSETASAESDGEP